MKRYSKNHRKKGLGKGAGQQGVSALALKGEHSADSPQALEVSPRDHASSPEDAVPKFRV
jgi:hypothetical protein